MCVCAQSYLTPCNPVDCSLPGCCVHGIFQGRNSGVGCQSFGFPQILWQNNDTYLSFESHCAIIKWCQDLVSLGTYSVGLRSSLASLCFHFLIYQSVQFSRSVVSDSLRPYWLQHPRLSIIPVRHQLLELAQTHIHRVSDAIWLSHSLSSPSPPAFVLSQYQSLFQWVSSSHQVAKVLEFQLQHQSFQWLFRTDFL